MLPSIVARCAGGDIRRRCFERPVLETPLVGASAAAARHAAALYGPELYVGAARSAAAHAFAPAAQSIGALAAMAIALNLLGIYVFSKVLDSPGSTSARRDVRATSLKARRLPGLSPGASAVALAQLRLALRTPRGRSILLSPIALVFGIAVLGRQKMPQLGSDPGLVLACFGFSAWSRSYLSPQQFAIDKGGLTRVLVA